MIIETLPSIQLKISDKVHTLYVATSREEKEKGLSGVTDLMPFEGMIFVYDYEAPRSFQFKETLVPLTIYFIDKRGKIIKREKTLPGQKNNVVCSMPCLWVVEFFEGGD